VNRVDEIIRFRPLAEDDLAAIVDIQLGHLRERLATRRLTLEVTDAALAQLATQGYDPAFGARPLKRLLQRAITDPLSMALLQGTYGEGDTVLVDAGPTASCWRSPRWRQPPPDPSGGVRPPPGRR
jgi:ATP-dependent Clp protease ATP-binding subunit ClpB